MPRLPRRVPRKVASRASRATKPSPSAPLSAMSATPATRNEGGCEFVPRLQRKTKVDVRLCHACHAECHAKCRGVTGVTATKPSPGATLCAMSATPATRNEGGCEFVPRLPRETKVDVSLRHACHAKRRWM